MAKYRKKPIIVSAVQWSGVNVQEICDFIIGGPASLVSSQHTEKAALHANFDMSKNPIACSIETLEGTMTAEAGDWIIRGIAGEIYPCKPEIFAKTYELVGRED